MEMLAHTNKYFQTNDLTTILLIVFNTVIVQSPLFAKIRLNELTTYNRCFRCCCRSSSARYLLKSDVLIDLLHVL